LWSTDLKIWQVFILIGIFFIGVWGALLAFLTWLSKIHTWFLAIFAVGIGAPRWCQVSGIQTFVRNRSSLVFAQMLWAVSSVALYVPWAGGAGPWISVSLWLWLGVLDAVQGVGLGMILLQTLSRLHVCATLAFSQMLGAVVVIIARATVPRQLVFPDFALWNVGDGLKHSPFTSVPFWIGLVCQIVVVVGYFWYYRKEQLGTWHCLALVMMIVVSDLCLFHSATINPRPLNISRSLFHHSGSFGVPYHLSGFPLLLLCL
jgi:alpha-1,3-glucan synthase